MKTFRKIILIVTIILLALTLKAYAGTIEVKLTPTSNEVKVGETVTVTLSVQHGNGVEGFDSVLKYDKTKLKLNNEEQLAQKDYMSMSGTDELTGDLKVSLIYSGTGTTPSQADIAKLEFEVLSGANVNDELSIKLESVQVIDSDDTGSDVEDVEVKLTVVEPDNNPGGDDEPGNNTNTPGGNTNTNTPGGNTNTNTPDGNANTNSPGNYPYAGIGNYMTIIIFAVAVVAIAIYVKINKYREIN